MQLLRGRTVAIKHLAISCDGRYLMAGTTFRHVWDLYEPKAKPRVISAGELNDWDLDVHFLNATQVFIKTVRTPGWYRHDLETGVTTDLMRPPALPWEQICVYPPSKTLKVLAGSQPNIRELTTYRVLSDGLDLIDTKRSPIGSLCGFSPAKTRYLAATLDSGGRRFTDALHDTVTDAVVMTFERPPGHGLVNAGTRCFSPDGQRLFIAVAWRLTSCDCSTGVLSPNAATLPINEFSADPPIAAHPDGHILAVVEDGRAVTFRDADTLEVLRRYDFAMPTVTCVAFTPDGTRCVIGNTKGKVLLFDVD